MSMHHQEQAKPSILSNLTTQIIIAMLLGAFLGIGIFHLRTLPRQRVLVLILKF